MGENYLTMPDLHPADADRVLLLGLLLARQDGEGRGGPCPHRARRHNSPLHSQPRLWWQVKTKGNKLYMIEMIF